MKKENNDIENDNRELFTEQFITDTLEEYTNKIEEIYREFI